MLFPLPLGAWDGLRYFIVALPEPSINYFVCFDTRALSKETPHFVYVKTKAHVSCGPAQMISAFVFPIDLLIKSEISSP